MWKWRGMEKTSWNDKVKNEEVKGQGGKEYRHVTKRLTWLATSCVGTRYWKKDRSNGKTRKMT